jgi:hypothetical protein
MIRHAYVCKQLATFNKYKSIILISQSVNR